ncbi:MAG: c-type cytochrome [Gemmatimonadota bacterium]
MSRRAAAPLLLLALAACGGGGGEARGGGRAESGALPPLELVQRVPLGALAGAADTRVALRIANPYEGDRRAERDGELLFTQMNCVGCHGYHASGGMGPNLTDTHWRYGGTPAEIFLSVWEGRPKGMPAYGRMLPEGQVWKLVAYLRTLGPGIAGPTAAGDTPGGERTGAQDAGRRRGTQAEAPSQ